MVFLCIFSPYFPGKKRTVRTVTMNGWGRASPLPVHLDALSHTAASKSGCGVGSVSVTQFSNVLLQNFYKRFTQLFLFP